jgi:hypothetical protein
MPDQPPKIVQSLLSKRIAPSAMRRSLRQDANVSENATASADNMADAPKIPHRNDLHICRSAARLGRPQGEYQPDRSEFVSSETKNIEWRSWAPARLNGRDRPANAPQVVLDRREGAG